MSTPTVVESLKPLDDVIRLYFADGTEVRARAVVIATGARYRGRPLARWHDFEGAGIFYSATEIEADYCRSEPVVVVGGANSSGQAALFLASRGSPVNLLIRHDKLDAGMSGYLARRIRVHRRIDTHLGTEVTALHGRDQLSTVDLTHRSDGTVKQRRCVGLFCFIGATPATDWLDGISLDDHGFVLTDTELTDQDLPPVWAALGRRPRRASQACSPSGTYATAQRNGWPPPSAKDQAQLPRSTAQSQPGSRQTRQAQRHSSPSSGCC